MIEINLLPGAARKKASGKSAGLSLKSVVSDASARVRDPFLISAVASILVAAGGIGAMHFTQASKLAALEDRERSAVADSARFSAVLAQRTKAEARRDSVVTQLKIIQAIDNDRFVWPHIMDEVSRALPPYTWLKSLTASNTVGTPAAVPDVKKDSADAKKAKVPGERDLAAVGQPVQFKIVGNTVDMQALTRFMKVLETSPYVKNVTLAKSEMVMLDGKEVTEFQLDAEYERLDRSVVAAAPVSLSVR